MWIHQFFANAPIDFEKKCKTRSVLGIAIALLGAATIGFTIWADKTMELSESILGFYTGCGGGLMGAGIVTAIKNRRYLKHPELRRKIEIAETDERNRMLGLRCWAYAGYTMFLFLYIGMLLAGLFSPTVLQVLLVVGGMYGLLLLIYRIVLQKAM